jgi:hypothetical protein
VRQSLVCLNPDTGALTLHLAGWIDGLPNQGTKQPLDPRVEHLAAWRNFTPIADGLPALRGAQLLKACFQSSTLALFCETPRATGKWRLYVYRCPDGVLLSESHHHHKHVHFALSRDGRLLALASGGRSDSLEVRDLLNPGAPVRTMRHGKFHNNLDARLGSNALLVGVGGFKHLIRWGGDRLEHRHVTSLSKWKFPTDEVDHGAAGQGFVRVVQILNSPFQSHRFGYLSPDPSRFVALREGRLSALIDSFGQIAMFDPLWNLVCMLFVFRKQLAAWMPDGTRYGPASLTGGPETPGAAEKIARRLQQASL